MKNSIRQSLYLVVTLLSLFSITSVALAKNQLADYSILPAGLLSGEDSKPNVMLVFDISGSMHYGLSPDWPSFTCINSRRSYPDCRYHPDSRSAVARTAMKGVFASLKGKVNMGLIVYDTGVGGGDLYAPVVNLDGANYTNITTRLDTIDHAGAIQVSGSTPIEGSLRHAQDYFEGRLPSAQNRTGLSDSSIYPAPQQCTAKNFVILVTDGLPTQQPRTSSHQDNCLSSSNIICSADAAADLKASSADVSTYVIGFAGNTAGINTIAASGGTGKPAFTASNGAALSAVFDQIFGDIFEKTAAFSNGSVLGSNATGAGVQIYPSFVPRTTDTVGNVANWRGSLQSFFIDDQGFLRQDKNSDDRLSESTDAIFEFELDPVDGILKYRDFGVERLAGEVGTLKPLTDPADNSNNLIPLWDAAEQLGSVHPPLTTANLVNYRTSVRKNRNYASLPSVAGGARYIFTCVDSATVDNNVDSKCDTSETRDLVWSDNITDTNAITPALRHYLLGADSPSLTQTQNTQLASDILWFTRGDESLNNDSSYLGLNDPAFTPPVFRKRTLNRLTADEQRYLLGDIVGSNALQVGPRNEFTDESYTAYRDKSLSKRNVVYVGANDGMLHAFNAGFFDPANNGYAKQLSGETPFDLGEELWAYVPQAVLPQLRFLADPGYNAGQHVYFVDGQMSSFDVQIFSGLDSNIYPNGWGTILVASTRLGGFNHDVDTDGNGVLNTSDKELRPSIMVFDITNPEQPPRLLAEISHPDLGVTSSAPTVVREGLSTTSSDSWHLVFGSGPTDLQNFTSDQQARVFKYKLTNNLSSWGFVTNSGYSNSGKKLSDTTNDSFVGNMIARDWDGDNIDDAVYFGTVSGSAANPSGDLRRINLLGYNSDSHTLMVDTEEPTHLAPFLTVDEQRNKWVISHSGRTFTGADWNYQDSTWLYAVQERFELVSRGVLVLADDSFTVNGQTIEVAENLSKTDSALINVTGVTVDTLGALLDPKGVLPTPKPTTFGELQALIQESSDLVGWRKELVEPVGLANERFFQSPLALPGIDAMLMTTFIPPQAQCQTVPSGVTYAFSFVTGTAFFDPTIVSPNGTDKTGLLGITNGIVNEKSQGSSYRAITRAKPKKKKPQTIGVPCENKFSIGLKGIDSTTATEELTTACTEPSRKSWVEIDLSKY